MIIREVQTGDLEQIAQLELLAFSEDKGASKEIFKYRINEFKTSFFVAVEEDHNQVVGFINGPVNNQETITDDLYGFHSLHQPEGSNQMIFGLVVHPSYRKRGIGGILLHHLIKVSRERNYRKVILTCEEELVEFYKNFGFEDLGISKSVIGNPIWQDMELVI